MKRVAIFHPVDDRYGASNILAYVLTFLNEKYVCDIYIPILTGEIKKTFSDNAVNMEQVNFIEFKKLPVAHRKMYSFRGLLAWVSQNINTFELIRKNKIKYDLFYINTVALFSVSLLCKLLRVKNIVHCHEYLKGSFYGNVIRNVVLACANKVICVSKCVANYIGESDKIEVVHNGIPDLNQNFEVSSDHRDVQLLHIAMIGRIMPEKGQWFLCDAVKTIPSRYQKKIKIHVFGDAPPTRKYLFDELNSYILDNSLDHVFVMHGFDPMASKKAMEMDVFMIPSIMVDPFPTTVLEGLSAGKILVTTNNGGSTEIIDDGINGFKVTPGDTSMLSEKIIKIIDMTSTERQVIQKEARASYLKSFTLSKFKDRFMSVLSNT
ncbi:glycosyltransferase family 4 protein [Citrobacter sp. ku-bf4]|uniref:glycosyltransferase family 4 protein n=1 Tax=Citrobacter TaxID=544 RepID=UPI001980D438|nr:MULTISPECIES: glycosyltransferase family 4 protein [Citrobacter]MBN6046144.1 glycosyltransferase family 4 protein [Citrobacter sp. ku-bf4]MBS0827660.1 glycosyltransferase family 4 protein [Citrobacter amalonaticus]